MSDSGAGAASVAADGRFHTVEVAGLPLAGPVRLAISRGRLRSPGGAGKEVSWSPGEPLEAACLAFGTLSLALVGEGKEQTPVGLVNFRPTLISHFLDWSESLGFAFFFYLILRAWLVQSFFVPSPSMEPNLLMATQMVALLKSFVRHQVRLHPA